jgi:hypothetical protein
MNITHVTINKIATEPFPPKKKDVVDVKEGQFVAFRQTNTKTDLVRLKVLKTALLVVSGETFTLEPGGHVWIRASESVQPWGTDVFEADGEKFSIIPFERIEFLEEGPQ